MIPYFRYTTIPVGPVHLQVWGLFVAAGILVATWLAAREAKRAGLKPEVLRDLAAWFVIPALIGGRLLHVVAYEPAIYLADPLAVLRVWEGGLSSFGGFIGALIGGILYFRRHKELLPDLHGYLEVGAFAFPLGYAIGRIGCFLIHDHPGTLSDAVFAVEYPGGARLDHGLLLSIATFAIFTVFAVMKGRGPIDPSRRRYFPMLLGMYGLIRFPLDLYRAYDLPGADTRYLGLTPAQYGSLVLIAASLRIGYHVMRARKAPDAASGTAEHA